MIVSKRHKKLKFNTKVARKITDIPVGDWNSVFPDVLESYNFFKTLDESGLEQFSFYYIMVYDRKTPVGVTACFLMNYSLDTSIRGPLKRVTNRIKKVMPNIFSLKVLICGVPMGQGMIGMAGPADAIIKAVLRRMDQIAKKNRASVVAFKDFGKAHTKVLDPLQREGFTKLDGLPLAELNIRFKDFEGYLMTLSSESRYGLKRKFRKTDNHVAVDMEIVDALDDDILQDVYRLYLNVEMKHGMPFELLPMEFFRNISRNMPSHAKFFLWKINGKLVMFLFCLISKGVFNDFYVGFDYEVAYKYSLYFIQFRDVLQWCIKHKIKKYEMGPSGYEAKRRLGFDFIPMYLYVKLRNGMLRPAFNLICQFLKFENFDPALGKVQRRGQPARY